MTSTKHTKHTKHTKQAEQLDHDDYNEYQDYSNDYLSTDKDNGIPEYIPDKSDAGWQQIEEGCYRKYIGPSELS